MCNNRARSKEQHLSSFYCMVTMLASMLRELLTEQYRGRIPPNTPLEKNISTPSR